MKKEVLLEAEKISRKPHYYVINGNGFCGSDTIAPFLKNRFLKPKINFRALSQYIQFGYVQPENTIFQNIWEVPSGYRLVSEENSFLLSKYWDLKFEPDFKKTEKDWCDEIIIRLEKAVENCLEASSKPVVFISGGMDSSIVMAMTKKLLKERIDTVSVGFDCSNRGYNELGSAKAVADYFGTEHHEVIVKAEDIQKLPQVIWEFESPFGNPTSLLTHILAQRAEEISDYALAGVGGDENFGGYYKFIAVGLMKFYGKFPYTVRKFLSAIAGGLTESTNGRHLGRRFRSFISNPGFDEYQRYINWISYFKQEQLKKLFTQDALNRIGDCSGAEVFLGYLRNEDIPDFLNRAYYTEIKTNVPYNQIRYFERTSRECGLNIRYPFCDSELVDFAATIPPELKIKSFRTKYLLRRAASSVLPEKVLKRSKVGFNAPVGIWFKDRLRPLVSRILSKENINKRGIFNYKYVREVLELHNSGKIDFSIPIWILIGFEVWARLFLDMKVESKPDITLSELFD